MNFAKLDHTEEYIKFCTEAGLPIGKLPKSKKDMTLEVEMLMQEVNPHLYQNLCQPSVDDLPADVALRYRKGIKWTSDVEALERGGFSGDAANLKKEIDQAKQQIIENDIAEMAARNDKQAAHNRDRPKGMQFAGPLPQEVVMRNKESWGITGQPSWE